MEVCFDCLRDCTRERFTGIDFLTIEWAKDKGRMTRFWHLITNDGRVISRKYKDNMIYYVKN